MCPLWQNSVFGIELGALARSYVHIFNFRRQAEHRNGDGRYGRSRRRAVGGCPCRGDKNSVAGLLRISGIMFNPKIDKILILGSKWFPPIPTTFNHSF